MSRADAERYLTSIKAARDPRSTAAKVFGWARGVRSYFQVVAVPNSSDVNVTLHSTCPCTGKAS